MRSICHAVPTRRGALAALASGFAGLLWAERASATLLRGLSLPLLVQASEFVLLGTPLRAASHWESWGGRQRIVTDTVVRVDDVLAKSAPSGGELVVRTLGGTVGERAALVAGEAALFPNETSVIFTAPYAGSQCVTGMAQGHYPLLADSRGLRLMQSPRLPELVMEGEPASRALSGQELTRARSLIRAAARR